MDDLISRQAAIHAILGQPPEPHYPSWYAEQIKELPSVDNEVGRPEEPNKLGLRNCPFCGKEAKVRMTNYRVVATPSGIKPYFAVTYTLGCFDCGVKFSYESKFELNHAGGVTITQDGYREAADKWNRRGEK